MYVSERKQQMVSTVNDNQRQHGHESHYGNTLFPYIRPAATVNLSFLSLRKYIMLLLYAYIEEHSMTK